MLKTVLAAVLTITIAVPAVAAEKADKSHKAEKSTKAEKKVEKSEKADKADKSAASGGPYYVVRDGEKPCTVSDKDPGEWGTAKALGEYPSKAEAEKNVDIVCAKEAPKKKAE